MAMIPEFNNLHHKLNNLVTKNELREYVGISQVGDSCYRKLQYYHYWAYKELISKRIQRLFDFGHLMEAHMIEDLKSVGISVVSSQEEIIGETGHWKGHIDGIGIEKTDYYDEESNEFLVEFKTHNDRSFRELKKKKVRESKPGHYDQMVGYMGYKELPKCLYVAYNKNDSEYYIEWVHFDAEHFRELKRKQVEVIASDVLLPRIGNDSPAWFECKMCSASQVCFGRKAPEKSCRTCLFNDVVQRGNWVCTIGKGKCETHVYLTTEEQREGCGNWELGVMFR